MNNIIKTLFKIIILSFIVFNLFYCQKRNIEGIWFLEGGNISLNINFKSNQIAFYENNNLVILTKILEYKKVEDNKIRIKVKKEKVGEIKEYQLKYENINEFIIWIEEEPDKIKLIADSISKVQYIFSRDDKFYSDFRYLALYELEELKNERTLKEIQLRNTIDVITNKEPLLKDEDVLKQEESNYRKWIKENYGVTKIIRNMVDYIFDNDPTTFWGTRDYKNPSIEMIIKDIRGEELKEPVKIKAIVFSLGSLEKSIDYYKFHRIKEATLLFSLTPKNSLGSTKSSFNYLKYKLDFVDDISQKGIIFYKPIKAKSLMLYVDQIYAGYEDAFAIYDIYIYTESE